MAKSSEEVYLEVPAQRRPVLSPELSPKTGTSELAFDDSSFDSGASPDPASSHSLETELIEIRHASEAVCRSAQDSLQEFRTSAMLVRRKILSMERQMASIKGSFVELDVGSKSSVRGEDVNNTYEGKRELGTVMRELQAVQELLQDKEMEFERREKDNLELKQDLTRLEMLVAEAARRREEACPVCECQKCEIL